MNIEILAANLEKEVEDLKHALNRVQTSKKINQWAASTFNENYYTTLVTISQKRKVHKKTLDQSLEFFKELAQAIGLAKAGERTAYEPELRRLCVRLVKGEGNKGTKDTHCSPVARLVFERILFPGSEDKLYGGQTFLAFLEGGCRESYPHAIHTHIEDPDFI